MSYISTVNQNRIAQFAARFEMQPDGTIAYFHPDRATGGLPCTVSEYEQLMADYAKTLERSTRWFTYWAILSGLTLGLLEASEVFVIARSVQYLIIAAPFPFFAYSWYQAGQKPLQLLGTRLRCAPPRTVDSAFWARVYALPASLIITMLLPTSGLIYYSIEQGWQHPNLTYLTIIACNLVISLVWLYAKFLRRR